ncbi:MAG: type III pantothenate kinase [Gemmatimonadetes bacterium]|nr:type III pantothenate kinase [Gemmatimonadota bacterium]
MQLVVDVGNTETVVGLIEGTTDLKAHWRLSTPVPRTVDEYRHLLGALLAESDAGAPRAAIVGSVVPDATAVLVPTLEALVDGPVLVVHPDSGLSIRLDVEEPRSVGADRVVNTLAARELYGRDTIAVDLGTATTFDLITADGVFMGGVIAPGVSAGLEWLGRRTAKLPRVDLVPPSATIGRRTETCIQSGVFYAAVDAVDGIVRRIIAEWGRPDPYVVATGGFATVIAPHCVTVQHIEPFLTLYGLAIAGREMRARER